MAGSSALVQNSFNNGPALCIMLCCWQNPLTRAACEMRGSACGRICLDEPSRLELLGLMCKPAAALAQAGGGSWRCDPIWLRFSTVFHMQSAPRALLATDASPASTAARVDSLLSTAAC